VRVIAGTLRGRRLAVPRNGVRPTADRVREAVFSSLGDVEGFAVLDLYAGSGSLGIEALSRGAARAVFVERGREAVAVLRRNLATLDLADRARVRPEEARRVVRALARRTAERPGEGFDLVFAAPPIYSRSKAMELTAAAV